MALLNLIIGGKGTWIVLVCTIGGFLICRTAYNLFGFNWDDGLYGFSYDY